MTPPLIGRGAYAQNMGARWVSGSITFGRIPIGRTIKKSVVLRPSTLDLLPSVPVKAAYDKPEISHVKITDLHGAVRVDYWYTPRAPAGPDARTITLLSASGASMATISIHAKKVRPEAMHGKS